MGDNGRATDRERPWHTYRPHVVRPKQSEEGYVPVRRTAESQAEPSSPAFMTPCLFDSSPKPIGAALGLVNCKDVSNRHHHHITQQRTQAYRRGERKE